jgi:hypothetical protein
MKRDDFNLTQPDIVHWTSRMCRARIECIAMATTFVNSYPAEARYWIERLVSLDRIVFRNADKQSMSRLEFFYACGYTDDQLILLGEPLWNH